MLTSRHALERKKYQCGGHSRRVGLFTQQLKKWVKAIFLLGCYGYISHGTGNLVQLRQNFGISGVLNTPNPPRHATLCVSCYSTVFLTAGHNHRLFSWWNFFCWQKSLFPPECVCACVHVCVRAQKRVWDRDTDRHAAENIVLFQFTVRHFCCACRMHNERNPTGNVQTVTAATCFGCVKWSSSGC